MYSDSMSTIRIPLLGSIATGAPLAAPDAEFPLDGGESIEIGAELLPAHADPRELFALEVRGSGMIEAGLDDCDVVVLQRVQEWADGDIVAVWLPDRNETVLTRLYREGAGYRLQAANATAQPVLIPAGHPLEVAGKVVAMIRTIHD